MESQDTRVSTPGRGVSREVNDQESPHWASQAAANLAAAGFTQSRTSAGLSDVLTRADAAQLLDDALAVLEQRQDSGWLPW